ncbi:AAA family ATPase [Kutzneria buriramensis]|uniref:Regulatory LuxR family protein n=1 Tax=Kutzneria buriramensis TaxID=1045776 RepID=A0A3E0I091_9PSEU|nr:LuxR family transcriptional regulator [Kutzneria buriramensis]REH52132.1 regulatory LuxR family protein [Kutzneria buriramensis]
MLIGRSRELARLTARVRELAGGRGGVTLVDGEPGIGKTTLLRAVCDAALDNGSRVFWGAGDELGQLLPLLPLLEALRAERSDEGQAVLRLLRGEVPTVVDPTAVAAERVLGMVEELCADGPVVLALDDLQWADKVTVTVVSRLVKLVDQLPLLLIGTLRPVPVRDDLALLWRQLGADGQVSLGPLPADAIGELVAALVGAQPSGELLTHAEGAAGNPLYATELVTAVAGGAARPGSLAAAIDHRLDFLSEQTRHVLRAATLIGVVFSVADLGVVLGRSVVELLPALDEAIAAGVLVESGDGLSFRHGLVRSALYERMSPPVRAAWHLEAARLLADAGAPVERVAKQLLVSSGHDDWTVEWLCDNAGALIGQSPSAAVDLLRRVLGAPRWGPRRLSLASRFADALYKTGDFDEAEQIATRALALSADPVQIVWLHHILLQCRSMSGRVAQSLVELDRALSDPETTGRVRARLLVLTARAHWNLGDADAAEKAALDAADAAPGDEWVVGWSLHVRSIVLIGRGNMSAALELLDHAVRVIGRDGATAELSLLLRINRAVALGGVDRCDEAVAAARDVRQLAEHVGNTVRLAQAQSALVQLSYDSGCWDDALVDVDLVADELKNPVVAACDHGIAALIQLHRGDHVAAARHLDIARASGAQLGERSVLQLVLLTGLELEQAGRPADALAALRGSAEDDVLPEIVRLAMAVGDLDTARTTTERVVALAADSEVRHRIGAAAYCRGLVDGDGEELLHAATAYRECGLPLARAKALEAAATAFVHNGQSSSARAAASRALDLYAELGAEWQLARAQSSLRGLGLRRGPKVKHRRAKTGWDSLTPAEATVAQLVVAGLSNPQIAERLFVSRRTVTTHVSHILAKLQVRTRTDIAREASLRQAASG